MNLVLGTAQFGLDYGVTNREGKLSFDSVLEILDESYRKGITELDTASSYGDSEKVLGEALKELKKLNDFKLTSKVYLNAEQSIDDIERIYEDTLENLKGAQVSSFLVHQGSQLIKFGEPFARKLVDLKHKYPIEKIGVSVYSIDEFLKCKELLEIETFQAPYNILNQSFKNYVNNNLNDFASVDIYVRSLFLQGILLSNTSGRPNYFDKFSHELGKYDSFVESVEATALEVLLAASKSFSKAKGMVFGCTNLRELKEIINLWDKVEALDDEKLSGLATENEELLNPSMWKM